MQRCACMIQFFFTPVDIDFLDEFEVFKRLGVFT